MYQINSFGIDQDPSFRTHPATQVCCLRGKQTNMIFVSKNKAFFCFVSEEEPEEVKQAWDELLLVQREQQRYSDIKYDLEQDLERTKKKQAKLEDVSFWLQGKALKQL